MRQADHILVAANFNGQGRGDVPQKLDVNRGESRRILENRGERCMFHEV